MRKLQQSDRVVILLAAPAHLEAQVRNPSSKIPLETRISPSTKKKMHANPPQDEAREDVAAKNTENKTNEITPTKKGKKTQRRVKKSKKNIAKELRSTGKSYTPIRTTRVVPEHQMKEPCKDN
ncbi:hypothetical protein HHI36_003120 [Cryptolaemus montrouzieri]|uniref:Uncharacterized protein n=1 Tax=Cryptolaemus montrouzieri TaxID=559131 RepID=A0ABD2PDD8_9CUCU